MLKQYNAIYNEVETVIVEKKSKFICTIKAVATEEMALDFILSIKKKYYDANHHCSAYRVLQNGTEIERSSDDREPSGTAGKPMMEVLRGEGLYNVVAVVTRYFGGVLLGTGGLIKAYTESIKSSISAAEIYSKEYCYCLKVLTDYSTLPKIEYAVHGAGQRIYHVDYSESVKITLLVQESAKDPLIKTLVELTGGKCEINDEGTFYVSSRNGTIEPV